MAAVRRTSGFQRAAPWAFAIAALGAGAWSLRDSQRGVGAEVPLETLAPRHDGALAFHETDAAASAERELSARIEAHSSAAAVQSDSDPGLPVSEQHDSARSRARVEQAAEVLLGDEPDERKIAYLRAVHEAEPATAGQAFEMALRELPPRSSPHSTSVPEFALSHLGRRAAEDAGARELLRAVTFGAERLESTSLRRQAATHLGRTSTGPELQAIAAELRGERDELLRAGFAAGLMSNPEERLVQLLFSDVLAAREALAGDGDSHQDPESR